MILDTGSSSADENEYIYPKTAGGEDVGGGSI